MCNYFLVNPIRDSGSFGREHLTQGRQAVRMVAVLPAAQQASALYFQGSVIEESSLCHLTHA